MDQYPVLHTLLGNNVKWSTAIKEADPNYFPSSAGNPQRPKVCYLLVAFFSTLNVVADANGAGQCGRDRKLDIKDVLHVHGSGGAGGVSHIAFESGRTPSTMRD